MENESETDNSKSDCSDPTETQIPDDVDELCPIENTDIDVADLPTGKELNTIHQDLTELVDRLNSFIAEQDDFYEFGSSFTDDEKAESGLQKDEEDDVSEKQDGPQEKELIKQKYQQIFNPQDIYVCDGDKPPEVDWDTLAPFIQTVVGDLQRIRQLNQMTNSVMERIRTLTESGIDDKGGHEIEDK